MTITLPLQTREFTALRVVTSPRWGSSWIVRVMASNLRSGFEVLRFSRVALPDDGEAVLQYHYGRIDGSDVDPDAIPDLDQHEVRIQVQLSTGAWKTAWWGQCVATRDRCFPGSDVPAGTREYHCVDALHRLRKRPLDKHVVYSGATLYRCQRHPGYNAVEGQGDRESSGAGMSEVGYLAHIWPGLGNHWTDLEAVQHALASSRNTDLNDPTFTVSGTTALLAGQNEWDVKPLEDCRSFLTRVLDRRRGRGLAFLDWTEASPEGDLTPFITVRPQVRETLTGTLPGGGALSLPGADSITTPDDAKVIDVDVIGDHRLGADADSSFQVAELTETQYAGVEVLGEFLRVLVTLSTVNTSLAGRYSATDKSAFESASLDARRNNELRWDHVYHRFGLPLTWDLTVGNGRTGTGLSNSRCDYRCNDAGAIVQPVAGVDLLDTSPLLVSFLSRLPMYQEYDYSLSTPARFDGGSDTSERTEAAIQLWIRSGGTSGSTDKWMNLAHEQGTGARLRRDKQDLFFETARDEEGTRRYVGDKSVASLSSRYNLDQLALTIGLQLPHRVRFLVGSATGDRKVIGVAGHHLWLAHPGAIFALGSSLSGGGYTPSRGAAGASGSTPGLLRDDRDALARIAAEAEIWYLRSRKTATWTLADCGFTDGWLPADDNGDEDTGATPRAWPAMGQVVGDMAFSGREEALGTPITRIDYDARGGLTTWATSWSDRDWR